MRICAVVPVFNHGKEAVAVVRALRSADLDVILVDDASDAETALILGNLSAEDSHISVVTHVFNQGKGGSVMSGLKEAHARGFTHALQIDADGQHDTADVPGMLDASRSRPNAVIAGTPIFDETIPRSRLHARYISHFWVWVETLSLDIRDSMCGFRIYPLEPTLAVMNKVRLGRRMEFDPEILVRLHWDGVPIVTFPTKVRYPSGGLSNFRPLQDNLLVSWRHTRLVIGMIVRLPRILARRILRGNSGRL